MKLCVLCLHFVSVLGISAQRYRVHNFQTYKSTILFNNSNVFLKKKRVILRCNFITVRISEFAQKVNNYSPIVNKTGEKNLLVIEYGHTLRIFFEKF